MYKDYIYKDCVTEESARRQRQLEQCLLELMLTGDYSQITISDISSRAGISRKSFYRYFNSKEGCLYALVDHAVFDGAALYLPNGVDPHSLQSTHERFFRYWKEQHRLLDALTRNNLFLVLAERMLYYTVQEEQEFHQLQPFATADQHERNLFYLGGVMSLMLEWHKSGFQKSVHQMSKILTEITT